MIQTSDSVPQPKDHGAEKTSPKLKRYVIKDYATLPFLEIALYGVFLVGVLSRAIYSVYEVSEEYKNVLYSFNFEEGWFIFGYRDKDEAEFEWVNWRRIFFTPGAWIAMVLHALVGRLVGYVYPKYRTLFLLCFALVSVGAFAGFKLLVVFLFHSLLIYAVACTGEIKFVWCTVLIQIASVNFDVFLKIQRFIFPEDHEQNMVIFIVAMCSLRHLSFATEYCAYHSTPPNKRPDQKQYWSVLDFLLYIYYFPLFFSGPLLTYDKFSRQINLRIHLLCFEEWKHILKELARYLFWALFMEITLHFLYFPSFHARSSLLNSLPVWAMGGLALCHLLFFQMKYVVMYGLPRVHAMFDHINAPLPPVCVLGMYLFQDFWRYFDRGLHSLLVKCIYIPLGGSRSGILWQMMASLACFSFVCFWHGTDSHLISWAVFNCVGLQMEIIVGKLAHVTPLSSFLGKYVSGAMYRRLAALVLTPNYVFLAFSNLVFLGGRKTAYSYYKALVLAGGYTTLATFATFYCTIQIIMTIHGKYGKDFMCNKFYYRSW